MINYRVDDLGEMLVQLRAGGVENSPLRRLSDTILDRSRMWIFVWRGWGPVAAVAAFLPLASCGGLMDWNPMVALTCFGVTLVGGGFACRHFGLKWNRGSGYHAMYWIPLEIWGWIYIAVGGFFGVLGTIALIKQALVGS